MHQIRSKRKTMTKGTTTNKKTTIQVQDVGMHEVRAPAGDSMDAVANVGRIQSSILPKLRQTRT